MGGADVGGVEERDGGGVWWEGEGGGVPGKRGRRGCQRCWTNTAAWERESPREIQYCGRGREGRNGHASFRSL